MKTNKCPLCGSDLTSSNMSPLAKRFWEIMNQVDGMNKKKKTVELLSEVSDEEFNQFMTSDKIDIMKSMIDRHDKTTL